MITIEHEDHKILYICCKSDSELPQKPDKKRGRGKIINYLSHSLCKIRESPLLKGAFLNSCALKIVLCAFCREELCF